MILSISWSTQVLWIPRWQIIEWHSHGSSEPEMKILRFNLLLHLLSGVCYNWIEQLNNEQAIIKSEVLVSTNKQLDTCEFKSQPYDSLITWMKPGKAWTSLRLARKKKKKKAAELLMPAKQRWGKKVKWLCEWLMCAHCSVSKEKKCFWTISAFYGIKSNPNPWLF